MSHKRLLKPKIHLDCFTTTNMCRKNAFRYYLDKMKKGWLWAIWLVSYGPWQTLLNISIWLRPSWSSMFFQQPARWDEGPSGVAACDEQILSWSQFCSSYKLWQNGTGGNSNNKHPAKRLLSHPTAWWLDACAVIYGATKYECTVKWWQLSALLNEHC